MFFLPKAVFFLKSVIHKWQPPFNATVASNEVAVEEGESFDQMQKPNCFVFRLVKCDSDKALVEFHRLFTLKGHLHPRNRQAWVGKIEETNFTYLWGNDGITKSLRLKEITY